MTKDQIISDIIHVSKTINKTPTTRDYELHGKYATKTVKRKFGSWSRAIMDALKIDVSRPTKLIRKCLNCHAETKNAKFCSSSCSTSYFNRSVNGRKTGRQPSKPKPCQICGLPAKLRRKLCEGCKSDKIITSEGVAIDISKATKGQMLTHDTQKYRRIRGHARKVAVENGLVDKCKICGYSLHVECCHRKPIRSFSDNTLISNINQPKNLVGLCRNHHWEFDHGFIEL